MDKETIMDKMKAFAKDLEERVNVKVQEHYSDIPPVSVDPSERPFEFTIRVGSGEEEEEFALTPEMAAEIDGWINEAVNEIQAEHQETGEDDELLEAVQEMTNQFEFEVTLALALTSALNGYMGERRPDFPSLTVFPVIEEDGFKGLGIQLTEDNRDIDSDLLEEVFEESAAFITDMIVKLEESWPTDEVEEVDVEIVED